MPARLSIILFFAAIFISQAAEKSQPTGFMLRATPQMRVIPLRGKRSNFVPPVKGVDATLVFAEWADLQPEEFGPIVENNIVDRALTAVSDLNEKHTTHPIALRLRTFSGIYAPDWVMHHTGAIQIDYRKKSSTNPVIRATPKFWTPAYQNAWTDFQTKMAEKYDAHPLICDVSISGSMTLHTEVMWRQPGSPSVLPTLIKAGLTRENDLACLKSDITRFMEIWKETPVEMTLNSRRIYTLENGQITARRPDPEFADKIIQHLGTEGTRLRKSYMIGNHSLSEFSAIKNKKHQDTNHIFHALKKEHRKNKTPLYLQTEVFTAKIAAPLIREGLNLGATLIELPNDITPEQIMTPELQALRIQLKSQL
ncbi:MAG: hypothetical protein QNK82_06155 [Akkermansiaceae bacterium]